MKREELRLGNWVKWMGKECKVDLPLLETEFGDSDYSKYVEPIKLTEQMLLDNGFTCQQGSVRSYKKHNIDVYVRSIYENPNIDYSGKFYELYVTFPIIFLRYKFKFVHELQNAYYLVNKQELDFKL